MIVVTYNSAPLLPAFFGSLAAAGRQPREIIVVDNGSRDGTAQLVAANYPHARLLANSANTGFGHACNQGAAIATGDLLAFLNPDVTFTPGWLATLEAHLQASPRAAIVCPETLHYGQVPSLPCAGQELEAVAAVPGSAMLVRRAAWQAIGPFDERIFLYWEDTELCWRAWLLGWQVFVDHAAHVFHARHASGGGKAWAAEAAKNGLYTHLKLMRWRRVAAYAGRLALKTVLAPRVFWTAWRGNLAGLGATLAARRSLMRRVQCDQRQLERMIDAHTRRQAIQKHERISQKADPE
ncbi:MAG TPA: glycosyltransferase family 2 protein [Roseiflexaceae bacterium]|nr:glycosyltransferase family 2 protein [Roseiflexaceae bacterium]